MKTILKYSAFLFISMFMIACKKDNPAKNSYSSPPYNEMTAKVNGVDWKACEPGLIGGQSSDVSAQYFVGWYLDIEGMNSCKNTANKSVLVYLKIYGISDTGTYLLGGNTYNIGEVDGPKRNSNGSLLRHYTDSNHTGSISITKFDTSAQKISGTFQFSAYNADSNEVVTVTDGQLINIYYYKF